MKASLKFRDDQRPLARAKIPISILGLPFLSGVAAGDSKDLRLDLLTAFESGPTFRASYRPNDPSNSFTFSIKTGIGSLGSPAGAPMSMTAEFNLLGGSSSPSFTVLFKPRFGDFSFKKLVGSAAISPAAKKAFPDVDDDVSAVWVETPGGVLRKSSAATWPAAGGIGSLLSRVEVSARSLLPLRSKAAVRVRWGLRVPPELRAAFGSEDGGVRGGMAVGKLPLLVMRKISIEHVTDDDKRTGTRKEDGAGAAATDVAEACMSVKKQLEAIQVENALLRSAVMEIRGSITAGAVAPAREGDVSKGGEGGGKREGRRLEGSGRGPAGQKKEEMTEELKKALTGAAAGGN